MARKMNKEKAWVFNGVKAFMNGHPEIKRIQKLNDAPSIHGDKVWDSCFVLMDFLTEFPVAKNQVVMDIGCGWGVLSSYLAKKLGAAVIGVDADPAVKPYFDLHAKANGVGLDFAAGPMSVLKRDSLAYVDILVGADICFWPELQLEWQSLIERAADAGLKGVYLADPGREPFWQLVKHCKKRYGKKRAQHWEHAIKEPFRTEKYVLELNLADD